MANVGKIVSIVGVVLDVKFENEQSLPNLLNALVIKLGDQEIVAEVAQHIGDDTVRCISMSSTDGLVRGMEVGKALATLKFCSKDASKDLEKVLRSAIANWEQKNERKAENGELYISKVFVDEGATLKRMRPAPQGRGYRIRKRSNHVTVFVDAKTTND